MRSIPLLALLGLLTACNPISGIYYDTGTPPEIDADEDGVSADIDCDDSDPLVNPGAVEICNGLDDDCSGTADDVDDNVWYLDEDGDGYGGEISLVDGCEVDSTSAWVGSSDDCDDADPAINPGATEVCNGIDDDCEGTVDEDATDAFTWYLDEDDDSYGDVDDYTAACTQPDGYVGDWSDCHDANPLVNPGQAEVCDELDNDCDGNVDEEVTDEFFADTDSDGYGDPSTSLGACGTPFGYVADNTDCDDSSSAAYPGATEVCDSLDNNCDGETDEDAAADAATWYTDGDTDGWGDPSSSSVSCSAPSGSVSDDSDCDDTDAAVNPGATETCNDVDDNCDGSIDPSSSSDAGTWYPDTDTDGYGDASSPFVSCESPVGYTANSTDCDDGDATSYPGGTEYCDGADNDCDGTIDPDSSADATAWYDDLDGDGYGDSAYTVSCSAPSGTVADSSDCDDSDSSVYPGATEYCDTQDNDCDGSIDEDVGETFYADTDGDGYGDPSVSADACSVSSGYADNAGDCDDGDASVNPAATEMCDAVDNNCDGETDEDAAADAATWYTDADSDGWGDSSSTTASCSAPSGTVADATDCDDTVASVNPGEVEICNDIDDDCDGTTDVGATDAGTWYPDTDEDGYGNASGVIVEQCDQPSGYVADSADCDDGDSASYPGATEYCDGADNDCDGVTDPDDSVDAGTWYEDLDTDGFGDSASSTTSCSALSGSVSDDSDCDDSDEYVNPNMLEVCGDTVDNDCDGDTDSSPCITEGSYEGDFTITLTETTGYSLGSDSCEGTASLTVDTAADPMISGTVECVFIGGFATYLPDTYTGTVEGDYDVDLLPSGSIDFSSFGWGFDWTDNGSGDTTLDGAFEGSDSYSILTFDYTGDFATDYTP